MCRVMAIRADSICRLVTYAGSRAWIAYSPKLIAVPPLAAPDRLGWCCLRCLTRRGISMVSGLRVLGRGGLGGSGALGAGGLRDRLLDGDVARGDGDDVLGRRGGALGGGAAGLGPASGGAGRARTALRALGPLATLLTLGEGLEGLPLGTRAAGVAL